MTRDKISEQIEIQMGSELERLGFVIERQFPIMIANPDGSTARKSKGRFTSDL
jgi:hypothetical protein